VSLDLERERVVQQLCTAYANDQLSTGELEARLERAYKSPDRAQLLTVLDGLAIVRVPVATLPAPALASRPNAPYYAPGRGIGPDEKRYVAFFAEVKKEGAWTPARYIAAKTVFGSVHFDFREAQIPLEGIELDLDVMLGEAKITLPPGVGAEVDCSSILGTVEDKSRPAIPGAPVVRVKGGAVLGSITVVTKVPKSERSDSFREQMKRWLGAGE
jgi:hypothetical protein